MAAPALIGLGHGSRDRRHTDTIAQLLREVKRQRPDLKVERAYLDHSRPGFEAVVDRLVAAGHREIVVVPLFLDEEELERLALRGLVSALEERHSGVLIRLTRTLGWEPCFLEVLDERLRVALRRARVRELDALVLAGAGSQDPLVNQSVARLARIWSTRHRLPVTAAYASSVPPATGEAVRSFRAEGKRHIAVASLFLTAGPLADRAAELAAEAGAVAVAEPLGPHPEVARIVLARYAVGAVELVPV